MHTMDVEDLRARGGSAQTADQIRNQLVQYAKTFKTSWVNLGQALYPVWKDKLFYGWGYDKFEYYTQRELGVAKPTALKLVKAYFFLEQDEPAYLEKDFSETREAARVPDCDTINVLRLARQKRELNRDDYQSIKKAVFDKGKDASAVRRDLTLLMKERKEVDPEEERQKRCDDSVRKLLTAINTFQKDMQALKLVPADILEEAKKLMDRLQAEVAG